MTSLLAALALARQNPNDPLVLLPPGWQVDYNHMKRNREGRLEAYLVGPEGAEVAFPAYGGRGDLAAELRGADPEGVFVYAVVNRREVHVAVARDGRFVVSYPPVWSPKGYSFGGFDYWAKPKTAREAVRDLLVVLTRIEVYDHMVSPPAPASPSVRSWAGEPLGWMSFPLGYALWRNPKGDAPVVRLESAGKPTVEAYLSDGKSPLPRLADPAAPHRWEETRTIFGRTFHLAEGTRGGLVAWGDPPPAGPAPTFTTAETSPRAAVVLTLMRLSFTGEH